MNPILIHIWGPLSIHAYGTCIALGIMIGLWLMSKDKPLQKLISDADLAKALQLMVLSGYFGGRILCLMSETSDPDDFWLLLKFWEPGLSILGCILGIFISILLFFWYKNIPILACTDRIAIYSPLVQSFGRLGCFFAGCCYGTHTTAWWGVVYDHHEHMAPLHMQLHPTQLYSAALLFMIFLFLYYDLRHRSSSVGALTCSYIMLVSAERFVVDFWRWDRTWITCSGFWSYFSTNQWVGLAMFFAALCGIIVLKRIRKS